MVLLTPDMPALMPSRLVAPERTAQAGTPSTDRGDRSSNACETEAPSLTPRDLSRIGVAVAGVREHATRGAVSLQAAREAAGPEVGTEAASAQ